MRAQFGDDFPVVEGATGGRLNPSEIRDALTGELFRQGSVETYAVFGNPVRAANRHLFIQQALLSSWNIVHLWSRAGPY